VGAVVVLLFGTSPYAQRATARDQDQQFSNSGADTSTLDRQLEECGDSCPEKPELDKVRREIDQANLAVEDANRFAAAVASGLEEAIDSYLSWCDRHQCSFRREAVSERAAILAENEKTEYRSARGNMNALKQYANQCRICVFQQDANKEIADLELRGKLFEVEVCSKEFLPVYVAFAGRPDPHSGLWITRGWYEVTPGKCKTIATLSKGVFFLMAYNKRGSWPASGSEHYCTSYNAFTRVLLPEGGDCLDDENNSDFIKMNYEGSGSKYTWSLDPIPWSYNAVAYSPRNSSWGWSGNHPSPEQAQRIAIQYCSKRASDCRIATWARDDKCIALASGVNALGWATAENSADAQRAALNYCSDRGTGCVTVKQSCSR
jgi:hypothetical protein